MATSNTRYRPDWSSGGITAPSVGDVFLDFADRMAKQQDAGLDRAIKQQQLEQEQKRWDITNARAEALAKRQEDEYQRGIAEKTATQEALRAALDPKAYQESKMAGEQAGIQASLANLSPQERAVAEQELRANYDPSLSRAQWLQGAIGNQNVDQSKVLGAQASKLTMDLNDPTSQAFKSKEEADKRRKLWEINAQFDKEKKLADLKYGYDKKIAGMKSPGTDLFYVPDAQGNYAPTYLPKGEAIPQGAVSESLYKEMFKQSKEGGSGGSGGSGSGSGKVDYITKVVEKSGTDREAGATLGKGLDLFYQITGGNKGITDKVFNAIEPGKEDSTLWFDKSPELNKDALKTILGNDKIKVSGKEIPLYELANNVLTDPDRYRVEYIQGQKKPEVVDTQSEAEQIRELAKEPAGNITTVPSKDVLTPEATPNTLLGIKAPTTFDPTLGAGRDIPGVTLREINDKKLEASYMLLPDYIKQDVSFSKYKDNPRFYEQYLINR